MCDSITVGKLKNAIDLLIMNGCPVNTPVTNIVTSYGFKDSGFCEIPLRYLTALGIEADKYGLEIESNVTVLSESE